MSSVYFGGSRNLPPSPIVAQVIGAVVAQGSRVHVGCQFGADQAVIQSITTPRPARYVSSLFVFAVAPSLASLSPLQRHISLAHCLGATVNFGAGGQASHIPARYLLRSIAAFQGCSAAVFFAPGAGSLAVAREAIRAGLPVFAFQQKPPARVPSTAGSWVPSSFAGFPCWQWQAPTQPALF